MSPVSTSRAEEETPLSARLGGNGIRVLSKRWPHHSENSGYHQVAARLGPRVRELHHRPLHERWIPERLAIRLAERSGVELYGCREFYTEWAALREMLARPAASRVYHVLYGDESFRYLGIGRRLTHHRLVATYHLPPSTLDERLRSRDHLRNLDALVVVGTNQVAFFQALVDPDRVFWVPHGIDTDVFTPGSEGHETPPGPPECLFVGSHARDFATLRKVIDLVRSRRPDVRFVLVTGHEEGEGFRGIEGVKVLHGIEEAELLRRYRHAHLMLQPLTDCTANNAVLEAIACGLPVVATAVGAVRDYIDEECALLTAPADPEAMAEAALGVLQDESLRRGLSAAARRRALRFDWSRVVEAMEEVYRFVRD